MSLEGLLKELDRKKAEEQEKRLQDVREQYEKALQSKDQEICSLREEIDTLRNWLDHSALPAFNPISQRKDSMGLIKMNFNPDKPCPEMWGPGEKDLLESVPRDREEKPSWEDEASAGASLGQRPCEPLESRLDDSSEKPSRGQVSPSFSAVTEREEPGIEVEVPRAEAEMAQRPVFELSREDSGNERENPLIAPSQPPATKEYPKIPPGERGGARISPKRGKKPKPKIPKKAHPKRKARPKKKA